MSRELKFRAWDGKNMYDRVLPFTWDFVLNAMAHRCTNSTGSGILGSGGDEATFEVEGYRFKEIMQFTGRKDKHGKEIYEGDIIECEYHANLPSTKDLSSLVWRGEVKYFETHTHYSVITKDGHSYSVGFSGSAVKRWEIIGNIHQNPELLTKL